MFIPIDSHRFVSAAAWVSLFGVPAGCAQAAPNTQPGAPQVRIIAPSQAVAGDTVDVVVWVGARWGREGPEVPTAGVAHEVRLELSVTDMRAGLERALTIPAERRGRARFPVVFRTPGLHRIRAGGDGGLAGSSAPVRVLAQEPVERVYWGDLHGHLHTPGAGHSGSIPAGEYERFLREGLDFARGTAGLDFAAFSPHLQTAGGLARPGSDGRSPWELLLGAVEAAHVPGEFVVFPAFEWQGREGDHVVIYPAPGPLEAPAPFAELCRSVRRRGALLTAHAVYLPSEFTADASDLAAVEVMRDTRDTEWFGIRAIENGVAAAFLGCSDTHAGALGSTSLTGLRAARLTRGDVLAAIRAGRTWATNGERIVLDFSVDTTGDLPRIRVEGVGTAPVERVDVLRNGQPIATGTGGFGPGVEFRFAHEDRELFHPDCVSGPVLYHARVVQTSSHRYDPTRRDMAISSPVAVEIRAAHFDAAYERQGGRHRPGPGTALVRWRTERSEEATRALGQIVSRDSLLADLMSTLRPLPRVGETHRSGDATVAEEALVSRMTLSGFGPEPRVDWDVPNDPRIWTALGVETPRGRELRSAFEWSWGYTEAASSSPDLPAARLRLAVHGGPGGVRLTDSTATWSVPGIRAGRDWVVSVPAERVPLPGRPRLHLAFTSPVRLERLVIEAALGPPLPTLGHVTRFLVDRTGSRPRAIVEVRDAAVVAEIAGTWGEDRVPLWSGHIVPGRSDVVLPAHAGPPLELRWGFAGWRRECGTVVPGHRAARPHGFGPLSGGRAVVALSDSLLVVDPASGIVRSVAYPGHRRQEPGREFCVADLGGGQLVVRGADGPDGWAARLDLILGEWRSLDSGPETGTLVAAAPAAPGPAGVAEGTLRDLLWLTGSTLHRRSADARVTTIPQEATGRLLVVTAAGESVVRTGNGSALRLSAEGKVRHRIDGTALAAGPAGDVLVFAGPSDRHAEISTGILLVRALGDGTTGAPHPLDLRPSPVTTPPVAAAFTPGGALLLLGGSNRWRSEPQHDWWGASVERWQAVWYDTLRAE